MKAVWWWVLGGSAVVVLGAGGKVAVDLKDANENEKKYAPVIAAAEKNNGIPGGLLHRLIKEECHFRTDIITGAKKSPVGAVGIAQFMPPTAKEMGINPLDPVASINAAAKYLVKQYKLTGSWDRAVASYNWGAGNVLKAVKAKGSSWLSSAPQETKNYVAAIIA